MEGTIDKEKLAKLKKMAAGVRTGGKGSVRRKKKALHKATPTDDKRLQSTLKRLPLNQLPGIEEVNIFKDNGTVINFQQPKVQAQISANTYVVTGRNATRPLEEMLPSIMNQLGSDNISQMRKLMDQIGASGIGGTEGIPSLGGDKPAAPPGGADEDDDDDIPDLVEGADFEETAKEGDKNGEENGDDAPPPLEEESKMADVE